MSEGLNEKVFSDAMISIEEANRRLALINHPPHYTSHPTGTECIDIIEHVDNYNLGAAMKYLWRVTFGTKSDPIKDLQKAKWHIERELKRRTMER